MKNINEVSEVNAKYIFFHFPDGTQDRKIVNKNDLKELYIDICNNMKSYDFMKEECEKVKEQLRLESDSLNSVIQGYEKYIAEHQEIPSIRRGLDNVCFNLEYAIKNQRELNYKISGVNKAWSHASDNYWKLYKLQKQIENVLKVI